MTPFSAFQMKYIQRRCQIRDRLYTKEFWGVEIYAILEPLLISFNSDWGVPKQTSPALRAESLPETTATVGLALYRLGLLDQEARQQIQAYLWSTHAYLAEFSIRDGDVPLSEQSLGEVDLDQACWSSEGRNVWTTGLALWTLTATQYRGPYTILYEPAINWLIEQQDSSGGWGFAQSSDNPPSIFMTATTLYTLRLCENLLELSEYVRGRIVEAVSRALAYLRGTRNLQFQLWPSMEDPQQPEPTASAMALWALYHCGEQGDLACFDLALNALRSELANNESWMSYVIAKGEIPDSGQVLALQGYTPAIPLALLSIGLSPLDPMVVKPLGFLQRTRQPDGWDFPVFSLTPGRDIRSLYYVGTGESLTFTTALVIQMVEMWHRTLLQSGLAAWRNGATVS